MFATGCLHIDTGQRINRLVEIEVDSKETESKVAVIEISGIMRAQGEEGGLTQRAKESIVARTKEQLDRAAKDPAVKAVVLRISSPGGQVYPSLAIHREITKFRNQSKKPVVAYVPDLAASGGYIAALAADEIMADYGALIGSIGVITHIPEVTGLMEILGIKINTFKSGEFKDLGNPFRKMTQTDRGHMKDTLLHYFHWFKELVHLNRKNLKRKKIDALADGSVYPAMLAQKNGLIDWIGDIEEAHTRAGALAKLTPNSSRLIMYRRPHEYSHSIYAQTPAAPEGLSLSLSVDPLEALSQSPFLYLWSPSL
jgi:protease-4